MCYSVGLILLSKGGSMCIFHKWSKWKQYEVESWKLIDGKQRTIMVEKRQSRKCTKCDKEQDEHIATIM